MLLYWGGGIFWAAFQGILLSSVVRVSFKSRNILATTISTLLFTATFVPFLTWFTDAMLQSRPSDLPSTLHLTLQVLVITAAVGGLVYQIEKHLKPQLAPEHGPRIWRRLPEAEQADIVRLSSEGHFVWIHTTRDVHRIRSRFADAANEMDGVAGGCVHRSHWVARAHVTECIYKSNRPVLRMSDGAEIPVSRTYQNQAEAMGLVPVEGKPRALRAS